MTKIDELLQKRKKLVEENRQLLDGPKGEDGNLSSEQHEEYTKRDTEIDSLEKRIETERKQEARERAELEAAAEREEDAERHERDTGGDTSKKEINSDEYREAWWDATVYGRDQVQPEQRELLSRHVPKAQDPGQREMRAMTTGDLATGGAVVPPATLGRLFAALKDFGSVEQGGASVLRTANGVTIEYPTYDETSVYGERLGENASSTSADPTMGTVGIHAHIYSSKSITVPITLVQDGAIGIEDFVLRILGERIGRKQNQDWTVGTGAGNAPEGIVTGIPTAAVTTGATGQSTTIKKADELITLQESLDPAYRSLPSTGWMMHHLTKSKVRQLKDNEGRYLWQPNLVASEPETLLGDRITLNNEMSSPGASNTTIVYGAMEYYLIRRVGEMMLFTLRETAAKSFQLEFVGFHRADGKLINAGTAPLVAWKHSAS